MLWFLFCLVKTSSVYQTNRIQPKSLTHFTPSVFFSFAFSLAFCYFINSATIEHSTSAACFLISSGCSNGVVKLTDTRIIMGKQWGIVVHASEWTFCNSVMLRTRLADHKNAIVLPPLCVSKSHCYQIFLPLCGPAVFGVEICSFLFITQVHGAFWFAVKCCWTAPVGVSAVCQNVGFSSVKSRVIDG